MVTSERVETRGAHLVGLAHTWGAELTAFGSRDGSPYLASIAEGGGRLFPVLLPGSGVTTSVAGSEETLATTQDGDHVRLYGVSLPDGSGSRLQGRAIDDQYTRSATRAWVTCGSEDPGYVVMDAQGWLRGVDPEGEGWLSPSDGLRLASPDAPLVVHQEEVSLLLAGDLREGDSAPRASAWLIDLHGTREIVPEAEVTGFTDISGRGDLLIAGHHEGRPVVLDANGRTLPAPPAQLDPAGPTVLVARGPSGRPPPLTSPAGWTMPAADGLLVVVQARQGIQVWRLFSSEWRKLDLPGERVQAARVGTALWFIADHELWLLQAPV